jgi:ankyrin repeat domain-containing protein 50
VTVRCVLEVLVKQTIERHNELRPLAAKVYEQHIREGTKPTEEELVGLLREFISRKAVTCYVLEALDEAPLNIQPVLLETLASLKARIFVTSRPMNDVQALFSTAHFFEIAARERDLDLHIAKMLEGGLRSRLLFTPSEEGRERKQLVIDTVKKNCGGM